MRLLDVRHQLSHVAIEVDVLLHLQLLHGTGEARDQDLEDAGHDLPFDTASPVTAGIVRCRDATSRREDVPAASARGTDSASAGPGTDHAGAKVRRVSTLGGHVGRFAGHSLLI